MVLVHDVGDPKCFDQLGPEYLGAVLGMGEEGRAYPALALMGTDFTTVYESLWYESEAGEKNLSSEIVEKLAKRSRKLESFESKTYDSSKNGVRLYSNKTVGSSWKGIFVRMRGSDVILKGSTGKVFAIRTSDLVPAGQKWALAKGEKKTPEVSGGVSTGDDAEEDAVLKFETWTSSHGKEIKAKFVELKEKAVVLEKENGKTYEVPLTRLSEESRKRVQELSLK